MVLFDPPCGVDEPTFLPRLTGATLDQVQRRPAAITNQKPFPGPTERDPRDQADQVADHAQAMMIGCLVSGRGSGRDRGEWFPDCGGRGGVRVEDVDVRRRASAWVSGERRDVSIVDGAVCDAEGTG